MTKRIRLIVLPLVISLLLMGCDADAIAETTAPATPTDADGYATQLLSAIEAENAQDIAELFSSSAQSTDLEVGAGEMLGYMQGKVISWDYKLGMTSASNHGGMVRETDVTMDISTDANEYRIAVRIRITDEGNPQNVGITSLYITEAANTDRNFAYWGGYVWALGIHIE